MNTQNNIEELWSTFESLVGKINRPGVQELVEELGQRIAEAPASITTDGFDATPGGLLKMTLEVTNTMLRLRNAFEMSDLPKSSLLIVGLFHGLGMIGDRFEDYLIPHDSDWHINKGIHYKYNDKLPKSLVSHRSLCLLQEFGVQLSKDEWLAIALSGGAHRDENKFYVGNEPSLAILLMQARQWVLGHNV